MSKLYNAGLYLRLSIEDAVNTSKRGKVNPFQNESVSIENQRALLAEYADIKGWNVARVYSDDGYSGGSFENRPAFHQMVRDAEAGLINLILVKDLSRFGRDYIETGRYTEDVFPALGVRFIALMDNIDSDGNADLLPFRSIMNDYHLRDLSRKVKSVMKAKAERGEYIGAWAPYGFVKDPACKNRLLIDEYASGIVRRIFQMRIDGCGYGKIAATLNNEGTLSPRTYRNRQADTEQPAKAWTAAVIRDILENESYIGHAVRFKTGYLSYKNRYVINRPSDEWIRCENVFPPIISQETWEAVRILSVKHSKPDGAATEGSLFHGLLRCADCGAALIHKRSYSTSRVTGEKKTGHAYICSKNHRTGGSVCSRHTIPEAALLTIIREDIQKRLDSADVSEDRIMLEIQKRFNRDSLSEAKNQRARFAARLTELEAEGKKLYEDRLSGIISLDMFKTLFEKSQNERTAVKFEYEQISELLDAEDHHVLERERLIPKLRGFLLLERPTHETLAELIEHIDVSESGSRSRYRTHNVQIVYRVDEGYRGNRINTAS